MGISRRSFVHKSAAVAMAGSVMQSWIGAARASAPKIPIGLELYTVNAEMQKDLDGTLRQVAAIGYRHVELPGLYGRGARELRKSLNSAGLTCESVMFPVESGHGERNLTDELPECIECAKELGSKYIVCPVASVPGYAKPGFNMDAALAALTLDDFKRNGDLFNRIGEQTRKAGIQFAYHNHNYEFRQFNGVTGYDELLRVTDAQLVAMEMDCGWVKAAGQDPVRYLARYPGRFHLLHIKDLEAASPNTSGKMTSVEVGRGIVDWKGVFKAAQAAGVKACFVEQEPPFLRPALESAKMSYEYLASLES